MNRLLPLLALLMALAVLPVHAAAQSDALEYGEQALAAMDAGDYDEAESILRKGLRAFPDDAGLLMASGQVALYKGDFRTAIRRADKVIDLYEQAFPAHALKGDALSISGEIEKAVEAYQTGLEEGLDAGLYLGMARALAELDRIPESTVAYEGFLELEPGAFEIELEFGEMLSDKGLPEEAVRHLARGVKGLPDSIEGLHNLGVCLLNLERFEDASRVLDVLVAKYPDFPPGHFHLGVALEGSGDLDAAVNEYKACAKLDFNIPEALVRMGRIAEKQEDLYLAEKRLTQAAMSGDIESTVEFASFLVRNKRPRDARSLLTRLKRMHPEHPRPHYEMARLLRLTGAPVEAREELRSALNLDPGYADALAELGWMELRDERIGQAEALAATALEADPGHGQANYLAAVLAHLDDEGELAETFLSKALAAGVEIPAELRAAIEG